MELIIAIIIGLLLGAGVGIYVYYLITKTNNDAKFAVLNEQKNALEKQYQNAQQEINALRLRNEESAAKLSTSQAETKNLQEKLTDQKAELEQLNQKFTKEFENLANKILDEKSQKFVQKNDDVLKSVLDPLKERLHEYEKRVSQTHLESEKERSALREQLKQLAEMNKRMSDEALNLTRALKGDSKMQGNWGEMILEKILEKSGLEKGREYEIQQSYLDADGNRYQPDVLIRLPENKTLIVDSKVSLVAYERYTSCEDEAQKAQFLKEHILSLRSHVKSLSSKSYQQLYSLKSLDFVLLFVPIESAFALAVSKDNELYNDAFDKNIIIVSTSTLLATLRTVANVWKQEYQSQNALEIARQGADLYDKFVAFTEDLIKIGQKMDDSKKSYSEAMKKLSEGTGNLVKRAETMKKLGLKASKQLPQALIDRAENG